MSSCNTLDRWAGSTLWRFESFLFFSEIPHIDLISVFKIANRAMTPHSALSFVCDWMSRKLCGFFLHQTVQDHGCVMDWRIIFGESTICTVLITASTVQKKMLHMLNQVGSNWRVGLLRIEILDAVWGTWALVRHLRDSLFAI